MSAEQTQQKRRWCVNAVLWGCSALLGVTLEEEEFLGSGSSDFIRFLEGPRIPKELRALLLALLYRWEN